MKLFKALLGLTEIIIIIITMVNVWQLGLRWLVVVWLVYLILCLCTASFETGRETK